MYITNSRLPIILAKEIFRKCWFREWQCLKLVALCQVIRDNARQEGIQVARARNYRTFYRNVDLEIRYKSYFREEY